MTTGTKCFAATGPLALVLLGSLLLTLLPLTAATAKTMPPNGAVLALHAPSAPRLPAPPARLFGLPDPFTGGRKRQGPTPAPKVYPVVPVFTIPAVRVTGNATPPYRQTTTRTLAAPIGRYVGWVVNSAGPVSAIFEDASGRQRTIHPGDSVDGLTVQSITPESLVLVGQNGSTVIVK